MKIALDAMGGDFAPKNTIEGAKLALGAQKNLEKIFIVGDESAVRKEIDRIGLSDRRIEIVHASQVVEMSDHSTDALRKKKDSSISVAVDLVKKGECEAVVSAGHTGAAVAAATIRLGRLKGVERPGIASVLPNEHGPCHIIDAGANPEARAAHIFQYAVMGAVYSRHVMGRPDPIVGLMSVGEEDEKGTDTTREVFALLKNSGLNFCGNVEGHDLFERQLDVIACDGFVGNVILKSCEATAKVIFKWLKFEIDRASPLRKLGALLAKGAFKKAKERGNYESYGGSPLLGVKGIVIIGHGSSSPLAIKNALRVAGEAISHRVNPKIEEELSRYSLRNA